MDKLTVERIFEPFYTTRPDGHGLGLATVREIVSEHGGAIDVRSTPGEGSIFEVWLPCIAVTDADANDEPRSLPLGHGETVLLVNDEREQLLKDEEIVAALGYEPIGFMHPFDALVACRTARDRFDAIVISHVPVAVAIPLAAAFKRLVPTLPLIMAARSADGFDMPSLATAEISEIVHGPLSSTEVAEALARCLAVVVVTPPYNQRAG